MLNILNEGGGGLSKGGTKSVHSFVAFFLQTASLKLLCCVYNRTHLHFTSYLQGTSPGYAAVTNLIESHCRDSCRVTLEQITKKVTKRGEQCGEIWVEAHQKEGGGGGAAAMRGTGVPPPNTGAGAGVGEGGRGNKVIDSWPWLTRRCPRMT